MKFFVLLIALVSGASLSFAGPIPPGEVTYSIPRLPGGTGFDKQIVQLHANQEDFDNGTYFLRIDVSQRKLTNYRLPRATFTNYCGHYRTSGGTIGDYKPKSIFRTIKIVYEPTGVPQAIFWFGRNGQDYNDTPVVQSFNEFHPRGTRIQISSDSGLMNMIISKCHNQRPYPFVRIDWSTSNLCRWKPEIWHKPNIWRDEYLVPTRATITKNVVLHCVNM